MLIFPIDPPRSRSVPRCDRAVLSRQSYGIPAVAWPRRKVYFKGGRRHDLHGGRLLDQMARPERGDIVSSLAILTDGDPSQAYGIDTLRGVTSRLLGK